MADLRNLADLFHWWGDGLSRSPTGDLARVTGVDRSKQRVLRRLMTPPGTYITHPSYGAGLPSYVGRNVGADTIEATIVGQMLKEASVAKSPRPVASVNSIPNGLAVRIDYVVAPEMVPAVLTFDVSP